MEKFGINNVRGGSFCQVKLNSENKKTIKHMINSSTDKCFNCGSKNHFANKCKKFNNHEDSVSDEDFYYIWQCEFCKKEFETEKDCLVHEKFYCNKYNKKSTCYRCGRQGHYVQNCFANKNIKGYYLY
jgi:hypothetical protein